MEDRILLAVLKYRKNFDALGSYVKMDAQEQMTKAMVQAFGKYFDEFPDRTRIETAPFYTWLTQFHLKKTSPDTLQRVQAILKAIEPDPGHHDTEIILKGLTEREFVQSLFSVCQRWDDGEEIDVFEESKEVFDAHAELLRRRVKDPWTAVDLDNLFTEEQVMARAMFPWCIPQMNESIGPAALGDFDIFGSGPGYGKTTFMYDNVGVWAPLAYKKWKTERPILVMVNEGDIFKHQRRFVQCLLHRTTRELIAMNESSPGKVREMVNAIVPYGNKNKEDDLVQIMAINQFHYKDVQRIIEERNPCAVLYDMLDNIKGFEAAAAKGTVDQRGEFLYQWGRDMAIVHEHFALATSQLSSDGEGIPWPQQKHLKGSRIAKQGACDCIIMMGRNDQDPSDGSRYISTPKEKSEVRNPDVNPKTMVSVMPDFTRGYICPTGKGNETFGSNSSRQRGGGFSMTAPGVSQKPDRSSNVDV